MRVHTTPLRFTSTSRIGGISLRAGSAEDGFSNEIPAQTALSLRAFPANPTYPLGSLVLSTLLELQAEQPEESEVDEDGRRKENPDPSRDKKAK